MTATPGRLTLEMRVAQLPAARTRLLYWWGLLGGLIAVVSFALVPVVILRGTVRFGARERSTATQRCPASR